MRPEFGTIAGKGGERDSCPRKAWAKAAGLLRAVQGRLVPVKKNHWLLDRPTELWAAMFTGFDRDLPDWGGVAAESYRSMMTNNVDGLGGLAVLADTMSAATQAAGNLVQFTRDIVRDRICDLVARVIVWAAEALAIVTIPIVTAQIIAAVAKWCGRIFGYTGALISSLRNLTTLMGG